MFHGVHVPQLPYPFICRWTSRLLPCPSYCKQCCNEHWGRCASFNSSFLGVYYALYIIILFNLNCLLKLRRTGAGTEVWISALATQRFSSWTSLCLISLWPWVSKKALQVEFLHSSCAPDPKLGTVFKSFNFCILSPIHWTKISEVRKSRKCIFQSFSWSFWTNSSMDVSSGKIKNLTRMANTYEAVARYHHDSICWGLWLSCFPS